MSESAKEYRIRDLSHFLLLWRTLYASPGSPAWEHILPYYDRDIFFKDTVQEIRGIGPFTAMTRRLAKRSGSLEFLIHNSLMEGNLIFMEWEMVLSYKKLPKSSIYGASRILLRDGKIIEQRDYYDLWGDIYDNIPLINKGYRWFMRCVFG